MAQAQQQQVSFVSIVQIAEEAQLTLRRVGRSAQYKTDCPFCGETKQNLEINVDKDVFHCWVCGAGGGVIRFYALLHGVSEFQARETLYPTRPGRKRLNHPALQLTTEQLEIIGFKPFPRTKPVSISNKDWFEYRKRQLNWVWTEWKRYESWKRGFDYRMQHLLTQ